MAPKTDELKLLRVVVREDFSKSRSDTFVRDLKATVRPFVHSGTDDLADKVICRRLST